MQWIIELYGKTLRTNQLQTGTPKRAHGGTKMSLKKKMVIVLIAAVIALKPDVTYTGDIHNEDGTLNSKYVDYLATKGGEQNDSQLLLTEVRSLRRAFLQ